MLTAPPIARVCPRCRKPIESRHSPLLPRRNRFSPYWRSSVETLNAGNSIQAGSADQAIRYKSSGIVQAGASDPCCCAPSCPCSGDSILKRYNAGLPVTFVISGVSACPCVTASYGYSANADIVNGTFTSGTVIYAGGMYQAGCTVPSSYLRIYSTSRVCTGTYTQTANQIIFQLTLNYSGTGVTRMTVGVSNQSDSVVFGCPATSSGFAGDFCIPFTFANIITACPAAGSGSFPQSAFGGTITVM
jgi:hypothetical protein